jgi:hypothetical protein
VLAAFKEAWNRGDLAATAATFADDAVLVGGGKCKGCPCQGRDAIIKGILAPSLKPIWGRILVQDFARITTKGDTVTAWWVERNFQPLAGAEVVRGWLTATVAGGLITSLRLRYDLGDPETVRIRSNMGDLVFALPSADEVVTSSARVLLGVPADARKTSVVVCMGDPDSDQPPMSAQIYQTGGDARFVLDDLVDGHSESLIPVPRDVLLLGGYRIRIDVRGESKPVADGRVLALRSPDRFSELRSRLTAGGSAGTPEGDQRVDQLVLQLEKNARAQLSQNNEAQALTGLFEMMRGIHAELDAGNLSDAGRRTALAALGRWVGMFARVFASTPCDPQIASWIETERATIRSALEAHGAAVETGPAGSRWEPV